MNGETPLSYSVLHMKLNCRRALVTKRRFSCQGSLVSFSELRGGSLVSFSELRGGSLVSFSELRGGSLVSFSELRGGSLVK